MMVPALLPCPVGPEAVLPFTLAFACTEQNGGRLTKICVEECAAFPIVAPCCSQIRMITLTLGGEGYLNFMGNEFGHPGEVQ